MKVSRDGAVWDIELSNIARDTDEGRDKVLSGHYHGGVVGLGAHRGLVTPDFRLFSKNCRGLFLTGGTCQIISAGTGEHTIPVRIWNRRELIITDIGKP